ncbi:MAG: leucine-rich repeat domain-containing protein, partial [Lachnospiraceae bacterium]|nr:leucine-rich repeat domain-containing protein [Lachnospiraceae bacterium]
MKKRILSVILALCLCVSTQSVAYAGQGEFLQQEDVLGCVAFAFILSDAAFGSLPARMYAPNEFKYEDIKPGDILRVNGNSHTVIVLEVTDAGVIVAEGNYNASIHWGRPISKEQVMNSVSAYITRYPINHVSEEDPDANQSIASDDLAEGLTWNLTKAGTLTISGKGSMGDFESIEAQPWKDYREQILKVVIEDGVTRIGACAFRGCGIFSAEIPTSVTEIGSSAFAESSILYVNLPSSVKNIGSYAFQKCLNLSTATVPEGVEVIGSNAFSGCTSLTSIALPASIKEVGEAAFFSCTAMISATFAPGSQQVKLGNQMFMECQRLMNITLPQSIDGMGEGMFMNCMTLAEVEIPQGVNSIDIGAFASSGLYTILIPNSVTMIGSAAFADCPLSEIYFTGTETEWNNNVRKIGDTLQVVQKTNVTCNYSPTEITDENTVVTLSQKKYDYDGVDKTPTAIVKVNDQPLTFRDCIVTYSNNTEPGTAAVTITGKFRYTGSVTVNFEIVGDGNGGTGDGNGGGTGNPGGSDGSGGGTGNPGGSDGSGGSGNPDGSDGTDGADSSINLSKANITLDKNSYTYDGTAKTPTVTVALDGKTLVLNTDYTVSYSNNIKVGTAAVTVTGK